MASTRFVVRGRVQGVGFRWFVSREATRLQLRGWARNLEDGSVEVLAVGEAEAVERLAALLGRGPMGARVDRVEKMELPHEIKISNTFDIS